MARRWGRVSRAARACCRCMCVRFYVCIECVSACDVCVCVCRFAVPQPKSAPVDTGRERERAGKGGDTENRKRPLPRAGFLETEQGRRLMHRRPDGAGGRVGRDRQGQ